MFFGSGFEATRKEKQRALSFSSPHKYKRELARGENKERERKSRDALEPFSFFGFLILLGGRKGDAL